MRIHTLPGVFRPRSDSLLLADYARHAPLPAGARVLDLCSGSGVVALAAAGRGDADVWAVDVSRRAVMTVKLNARLRGVRVKAQRGDLFEPVKGMRFDLIVSNPPYLPTPEGNLPARGRARAWDAGFNGRIFLDRICAEAAGHLRPGGAVLLVHSSVCGEQQTLKALAATGLRTSVVHRSRGPLGPLLAARADWLRERGLVGEDGQEEILIIRGEMPEAHSSGNSTNSSAMSSRTARPRVTAASR